MPEPRTRVAACGCVVHLEAAGPHIYGGGLCKTADRLMRADPTVGTREDYRRHIARAIADAVRDEQAAERDSLIKTAAFYAGKLDEESAHAEELEARLAEQERVAVTGGDPTMSREERNQRTIEMLREWREHPSDEPLPEIEPVQFREVDVSDHKPKEEAPPTDTAERDAAYLAHMRETKLWDLPSWTDRDLLGLSVYKHWCAAWEARGVRAALGSDS